MSQPHSSEARPILRARRLQLFTQREPIVVMRADCHVCRAEGLSPRAQVLLSAGGRQVYASLFQIGADLIGPDDVVLSEDAWALLGVSEGDPIEVRHAPPLTSMASVRRRIYGNRLDEGALRGIIGDVATGRYTNVHLAAFLTAASALPLDDAETIALTAAMVGVGDRLTWAAAKVIDKHCVGGLPGNRTTPIVVAILAANGLVAPKTSSRAITSPAGTADTMETLAPVNLDLAAIRRVVDAEGGCVVWGGAVRLSPADDVLIRVERVLDIDTEGQLVASVLSKKLAAGSTHVVVDIPVGPTAKVRSEEAARALAERLSLVASEFGLQLRCIQTSGDQPVGRGVGPALEAHDVLAVLRNAPNAPADLCRRAIHLAGAALELAAAAPEGQGARVAEETLVDGRAWAKFQRICEAQGGMRVPPTASLCKAVKATSSGRIVHVNNRKIATLAKLAGAPESKAAGLMMHARLGEEVASGQPLVEVHAETPGELEYALEYAAANPDLFEVEA